MLHKISVHRVPVHVLQFFLKFFLIPHIEVIESRLPERRIRIQISAKRKFVLATGVLFFLPQFTRYLLLQYLERL